MQHIWQYEDGGRFHDYDGKASDIVEQCYQEYVANPHMMDVRAVKSGDWEYQVDFINMKQTSAPPFSMTLSINGWGVYICMCASAL